mgnify:CR=1 FL=1
MVRLRALAEHLAHGSRGLAEERGQRHERRLEHPEQRATQGVDAPDGEYETIGGLVLAELGHIPQAGESVELTEFDPDGDPERPVRWLATVAAMDGRRIDQLHLTELGPRGLDGGRR